jgi:K+-transporting ATPase KdpF subunit
MGFDYAIGAIGGVLALVYLVIALLRPEKFG